MPAPLPAAAPPAAPQPLASKAGRGLHAPKDADWAPPARDYYRWKLDIGGVDKVALLQALWANQYYVSASPHATQPWTETDTKEAAIAVAAPELIGHFKGRRIDMALDGDSANSASYDLGAAVPARNVVARLRRGGAGEAASMGARRSAAGWALSGLPFLKPLDRVHFDAATSALLDRRGIRRPNAHHSYLGPSATPGFARFSGSVGTRSSSPSTTASLRATHAGSGGRPV
jgi:hypothetical protein